MAVYIRRGTDTQLTQGEEITSHIYIFQISEGGALPINPQERTFNDRLRRSAMSPKRPFNARVKREARASHLTRLLAASHTVTSQEHKDLVFLVLSEAQ